MFSNLNTMFRQLQLRISQFIWRRKLRYATRFKTNDIQDIQRRLRRIAFERSKMNADAVEQISTTLADQISLNAPNKTDWCKRPKAWSVTQSTLPASASGSPQKICSSVILFHDCPLGNIQIEQTKSSHQDTTANFDLSIKVGKFEGSYLSLVVTLPNDAIIDLSHNHILQSNLLVDCEPSMDIYARLNLKSKSGTQQIIRTFEPTDISRVVNFDLQGHVTRDRIIDKSWIDVSFDNPENQSIILHDLTCFRRRRAAI
ncbi:hypothetical protein BFP76_11560 [Amylibacter kogurei]|uniref:Uncharacterized protein n=1 Tax=Paramylibacter kogurei TaxID=1889778 RepID=A0A2G5KBV6_9RHOB|nr:DUF6478 family protein [Amylibacter kogurei]PIB26532.1 hypothetical protein BFP76_11560 [Amylibacter kogurei]